LYGTKTKKVREQFFDAKEADKLIEIISTTAGASGVRISASKPVSKSIQFPPPFNQRYMPISYELTAEGTYHNLGLFINGLEEYSKHFSVSNVEISGDEKSPKIHRCSLSLTAFLKRG
jgi:Tfp pilus assembly protein PilO